MQIPYLALSLSPTDAHIQGGKFLAGVNWPSSMNSSEGHASGQTSVPPQNGCGALRATLERNVTTTTFGGKWTKFEAQRKRAVWVGYGVAADRAGCFLLPSFWGG